MKVVLLQGAGEVAKREKLIKIKKEFASEAISFVDIQNDGLGSLERSILSTSLFSMGPRLVVAENVPERLRLETIPQGDSGLTLLLVTQSVVESSPLLQSAKKIGARIINFKVENEVTAFPFLDNLIEGRKESLALLGQLLEQYGAFYLLSMIYYLLRRNILPLPSSFMGSKIQKQRKGYRQQDWERIYETVIEAEMAIKNGLIPERDGLILLTARFIERHFS